MIDAYPEDRATRLIEKYPQFTSAGPLVVDAILFALPQIDQVIFGTRADMAVDLLACDWLMCSEFGQSLRGDDDTAKPSRFRVQYEQLLRQVAPRMIVI